MLSTVRIQNSNHKIIDKNVCFLKKRAFSSRAFAVHRACRQLPVTKESGPPRGRVSRYHLSSYGVPALRLTYATSVLARCHMAYDSWYGGHFRFSFFCRCWVAYRLVFWNVIGRTRTLEMFKIISSYQIFSIDTYSYTEY